MLITFHMERSSEHICLRVLYCSSRLAKHRTSSNLGMPKSVTEKELNKSEFRRFKFQSYSPNEESEFILIAFSDYFDLLIGNNRKDLDFNSLQGFSTLSAPHETRALASCACLLFRADSVKRGYRANVGMCLCVSQTSRSNT